MAKKKDNRIRNFMLIIITIGIILTGTFLIQQTTLPITREGTALGYSVLHGSQIDFGSTQLSSGSEIGTVTNDATFNSLSTDISIDITDGMSPTTIAASVETTNLTLNINRLEKLTLDFTRLSSSNGCTVAQSASHRNGGTKVSLSSPTTQDIVIYDRNKLHTSNQLVSDDGRITVFKNQGTFILDINADTSSLGDLSGEDYELLIETKTADLDCNLANTRFSETETFEITNLEVTLLLEPSNETDNNDTIEQQELFYRFENNTCEIILILPSERTTEDFETLTTCQENIIISNETGSDEDTNDTTVTLTCVDSGCPTGFECNENKVCVETPTEHREFLKIFYWILGGLGIVGILILIIFLISRKRKNK